MGSAPPGQEGSSPVYGAAFPPPHLQCLERKDGTDPQQTVHCRLPTVGWQTLQGCGSKETKDQTEKQVLASDQQIVRPTENQTNRLSEQQTIRPTDRQINRSLEKQIVRPSDQHVSSLKTQDTLLMDYSSTFNSHIPHMLSHKLSSLNYTHTL